MRYVVAFLVAVAVTPAAAGDAKRAPVQKGTRIYQTDSYGRVRENRPSWVVKDDGRLVEVSPYGREQPQKKQYVIEGDRVYHADFAGRIQHDKPSYSVEAGGRVIARDKFGNPQYHKPQFVLEDSTVYKADAVGRPTRPAYKIDK